jgi:SnoaL-like domain
LEHKDDSRHVVMSYINALHGQKFEEALRYLDDRVRIRGPAGETFGKPTDFIDMLRKYHGKYDVKKVFNDANEVSVWYDLDTSVAKVSMASWYQVKDGRIISIQTLFDPKAFGPPPKN